MQHHSATICEFINGLEDSEAKTKLREAYKDGVYAPCISLQVALGEDAMERGKVHHEEQEQRAKEYFASRHALTTPPQPA